MTAILSDLDVACHCDGSDDGHAPGAGDCTEQVKASAAFNRSGSFRNGGGGIAASQLPRSSAPTGTCRTCGRTGVKVVLRTVLGRVSGQSQHRIPLERRIALVDHKTPGRDGAPCSPVDPVPAETRWTPPKINAVADWEREHGPGSVVVR